MEFRRGQIVRLRNGWTPMQIIDVNHSTGKIRAKYCHKYPVLYSDFEHPYAACSCQHRHALHFVPWDGDPDAPAYAHQPTEESKPIMNKYTLKSVRGAASATIGTEVGQTLAGDMILEMSDGSISIQKPHNIEPYYQRSVLVRGYKSSYRCNYILPDNHTVKAGDWLASDSGNLYIVEEIDTQGPGTNIKGEFKGKILIAKTIA